MFLDLGRIFLIVTSLSASVVLAYVVKQVFFHPLARYPGPFLASITDIWQVFQFLSLEQPYRLTELHERYGPVVRYGPDKISITLEEAVFAIYPTTSKSLPKTEFYDAFGGNHPNVFGTRDEAHHSTRRRQMSHAFSMTSIKEMEQCIDTNIAILRERITEACDSDMSFDLKAVLHSYIIDVLGELAFGESFGLQVTKDLDRAPPVKEHTLLGSALGSWPTMQKWLKWALPKLPIASIQKLFEGRRKCAELAAQCVRRRLAQVHRRENRPRKDLLTTLIHAKDPITGAALTQLDLETEAFGFIIAGTHTTMATISLLFWHLLHNPHCMAHCVEEMDNALPPLPAFEAAYSITNLEASLPYLRNCVKENHRVTPVFTMPLARRINQKGGLSIAGENFPEGTSIAICNHALHHNAAIWKESHNIFDPDRWNDPATAAKSRILMHFGLGGRQCIGKNLATTNIYKVVVTLLRHFNFELADEKERNEVARGEWKSKFPKLISVGISDIDGGLWVKARIR